MAHYFFFFSFIVELIATNAATHFFALRWLFFLGSEILCMCQFSVDRCKFMCYAHMLLHAWHLQKLNACYQEFQHHWISMSIGALHFNTQLSRQIKWTLAKRRSSNTTNNSTTKKKSISSKTESSSLPYLASNLVIMAVRFVSDTFWSQCNGVQISQASFFQCYEKSICEDG